MTRSEHLFRKGARIAALAFGALGALPAAAACLSPTDIQDGGMVVYKCDEPENALGAAFTEQEPANQTVILKTEDAAKADDRLKDETPAAGETPVTQAPKQKAFKTKSASQKKPAAKKKKPKATKSKSSKIVHLKKPGLGARIKYFLFGI